MKATTTQCSNCNTEHDTGADCPMCNVEHQTLQQRINCLHRLYGAEDVKQSPINLPSCMILEHGDITQLHSMSNAAQVTWFVITNGFYGRGKTLLEAATNCRKAGSPTSYAAQVTLVTGDSEAKIIDCLSIEYRQGATCLHLGKFAKLLHLTQFTPAT